MAPQEQPDRYSPGCVLGNRFRIVQFLGRGGMGEVYEAVDDHLRQRVALKIVRPEKQGDQRMLALLRDEVRKARSVSHTNVCRVFDIERDEESGVIFIAMELLRGETLSQQIERKERFTPQEALPTLRQIAAGMDAIHACRILHLDLKPGNVMVEPGNASAERVVVNDFGLAESQAPLDSGDSTLTLTPSRGGTLLYMAPERFDGSAPLSPRADVYSFGLIAYEMLAGRRNSQPAAPPPPLRDAVPEIPAEWDRMVGRCLAMKPPDRFATCGEAMASLSAASQPSLSSLDRWVRRPRRALALLLAVAALAAAGFLAATWGANPSAEAMGWYRDGVKAIGDGTYYKALRALEQAVRAAPDYPLARAGLAEAWLELDSPERSQDGMLRAADPAGAKYRLNSRDREYLAAMRETVTRNFPAALKIYEELARSASAGDRAHALVDLGRALQRSKEPAKAMEQYKAAIRLDANDAGAWLRLAGVAADQPQQSQVWADALRRAEALFQAASNQEGLTEVFYQRGTHANRASRPAEAAEWLEKARQSALVTHNPHQEIRALYQLSTASYQKGDADAGQKLAEEAIGKARANNIEFLAGRGYYDLGNALAIRGDYAKAAEYFNEALRIARNYHGERLEAMSLYALGSIALRTGDDEGGAKQVGQALAWFQANSYPYEASTCALALGMYQRNRGDLDAAAAAFGKELQLAQTSHDDAQAGLAMSRIALIMIRQERYPEALKLALDDLAIFRRLQDGLRTGYALESLAVIDSELGRFADSAAAVEDAQKLARSGGMDELLADLEVERARAALLAGRAGEAAQIADRGAAAYESKHAEAAGAMFEILALARSSAPLAAKLGWCERAARLASGPFGNRLSARLTEATLRLRAHDAKGALAVGEIIPALERQKREYSLFQAELIEAMALRQLSRDSTDSAKRASDALERFQKEFDAQAWDLFRSRPDFIYWQKILGQLTK